MEWLSIIEVSSIGRPALRMIERKKHSYLIGLHEHTFRYSALYPSCRYFGVLGTISSVRSAQVNPAWRGPKQKLADERRCSISAICSLYLSMPILMGSPAHRHSPPPPSPPLLQTDGDYGAIGWRYTPTYADHHYPGSRANRRGRRNWHTRQCHCYGSPV